VNLRQQRIGNSQAEDVGAGGIEQLKRAASEDQGGNVDVGVGSDVQRHLMSLAAFSPGLGDQPWQVSFGEAKFAGAGLAAFNEPAPAPVLQICLGRLAHQLAGLALVFIGRGGDLRNQAWRDEGIGCSFGFVSLIVTGRAKVLDARFAARDSAL